MKEQIEQAWLKRAKTQGFKKGSKRYQQAEMEFFCGAMAAIEALKPNENKAQMSKEIPPIWVINAMCGRDIVEGEK